MPGAFVDTNIIVYAADQISPPPRKTRIARELLLQRGLHLSVQVLNEFTVNARNPNKLNLSAQRELEWIERLMLLPVEPINEQSFLDARLFNERYQVSHWDGLILAAAKAAACDTLLSEDLQNGQVYDGITVIDPFA